MNRNKFKYLAISFLFPLLSCAKINVSIPSDDDSTWIPPIGAISIKQDLVWKEIVTDAYGANTQTAKGLQWNDEKFLTAIDSLYLGNLRWPGGQVGNYLDWRGKKKMDFDCRAGMFYGGNIPLTKYMKGYVPIATTTVDGFDYSYSLQDLKRSLNHREANNMTPIYMINMLTDTLGSTLDMFAEATRLGLSIKYIELGNEFYLTYLGSQGSPNGGDIPDCSKREMASDLALPTANRNYTYAPGDYALPHTFYYVSDYANECNRWISAIRRRYPQAEFAFVGTIDPTTKNAAWFYNSQKRQVCWNDSLKLLIPITFTNKVTIHYYININQDKGNPLGVINSTFNELDYLKKYISYTFSNYKVWITEYNLRNDNVTADTNGNTLSNPYSGRWVHGLASVIMTGAILSIPQVELTCIHDICGSLSVALIMPWDDTILAVPEDLNTYKIKKYDFTAQGMTHKLFGKASYKAKQIAPLVFNNNKNILVPKKNIAMPALCGWAFSTINSNISLLIVNMADSEQIIYLPPSFFSKNNANLECFSMPTLSSPVLGEASVTKLNLRILNNKIILPAFSVSTIK